MSPAVAQVLIYFAITAGIALAVMLFAMAWYVAHDIKDDDDGR